MAIYYIDYADGSDSNAGTSRDAPWKHSPGMYPFRASYTHQDGDRFIFKGGVTWPREAVPLYITVGGADGNYDYYGADETWHTGDSFTKPTFTSGGQPFLHPLDHRENMIRVVGSQSRYIQFDNLRITQWLVTDPVNNETDCAGVSVYSSGDILVSNCYIGDWTVGNIKGGAFGVCAAWEAWPVSVRNCVIEGPHHIDPEFVNDPEGFSSGTGARNCSLVEGCDISRVTQGTWGCYIVRNNVIHDGGADHCKDVHENLTRTLGGNLDFYNNLCYNWHQGIGLYCNPSWGGRSSTHRVWNNIFYKCGQHQLSNEQGTPGNTSGIFFSNNTIADNRVTVGFKAGSADFGAGVVLANNIFINDEDESFVFNNTPADLTHLKTVIQTYAEAEAVGATYSNNFELTTPCPGVTSAGTNECSAVFDDDFHGIARPQGQIGVWDIGAYEFRAAPEPPEGAPTAPTMKKLITVTKI